MQNLINGSCSSQLPLKFMLHARNISSVWIVPSYWVSLRMKSGAKIQLSAHGLLEALPKPGDKPWIFIRYYADWNTILYVQLGKFLNRVGHLTARKCDDLINRPTITQAASWRFFVQGKQTTKSIGSHFHSGIGKGYNNPVGLWCSVLTCWQVKHLRDKICNIAFHTIRLIVFTQIALHLCIDGMYSVFATMSFTQIFFFQLVVVWYTNTILKT